MDIASNIKRRRLELGLSQYELASAIGYRSRSSIAKIESGAADVPLSKLIDLAHTLDVSIEELLAGPSHRATAEHPIPLPGGTSNRRTASVILAGGKSSRNLQNIPNQFLNVLGKPVVSYCLDVYQNHPLISDIYIVCSEEWVSVVEAYVRHFSATKVSALLPAGRSGVLSTRVALERVAAEGYGPSDLIILQESTRPLVTGEMISSVLSAASRKGHAITGERMVDKVQFLVSDSATSYVDRDNVVDLQSPDAYTVDFLKELFNEADRRGINMTHSCIGLLMDDLGHRLNFVEGPRGNIKIVRPNDIAVFAALAKQLM